MVTFATLILMRKLDLEKVCIISELCEWRPEFQAHLATKKTECTLGDSADGRWHGWEMVTMRKYTGMEEHVVFLDFIVGNGFCIHVHIP